jgi:hypothetical protein
VGLGTLVAVAQYGLPWSTGDRDRNHAHDCQRYQVHVQPQYDGQTPLPVVAAIHGCGMTGFGWNSMKSTTQFNSLADREGFIVVYPTQQMFRDKLNCWRSNDPREQQRYAGEPALLAGDDMHQEAGGATEPVDLDDLGDSLQGGGDRSEFALGDVDFDVDRECIAFM